MADAADGLSEARRELLALWLQEDSAGQADTAYIPPQTEHEHVFVQIWSDVLGVARVGVADDYFALGGDSIHAIVIVARLQAAGLHIVAQDLFEHRTIREVAALATPAADPAGPQPVTAAGTALRLGPMQQGMLYHAVAGRTPGAYLVQVICRLIGELDEDLFAAAWQYVVAANPALRTSFLLSEGEHPHQLVHDDPDQSVMLVTFVQWRGGHGSLQQELERDRAQGFELTRAPLMRLTVLRESEEQRLCVWTHHHLILDGWSQQLVLRDVFDCYASLRDGDPRPVTLRRPFSDYLDWLARRDQVADENYWSQRLAGLAALTPIAGPERVGPQPGRAELCWEIAARSTEQLDSLCRRAGLTLAAVLVGGWMLTLAARHHSEEALCGLTVSGRPPELTGATEIVGMFVNTLPLRVPCPRSQSVLDWLGSVQHSITELIDHQHISLGKIEGLAGRRAAGGLFDSIVVMENFPAHLGQQMPGGLRVAEPAIVMHEDYPLVLEIVPGTSVQLRMRYDRARLDTVHAEAAQAAIGGYLDAVLADPAQTLGAVLGEIADASTRWSEQRRHEARQRAHAAMGSARRVAVNINPAESNAERGR
ncbi:non-ribosomal peptide synthase/amino acid adenylation enzyme [Mycobacteroides abscessus subsp. abscessus]|uniref:condensation domain-containing protein n=1 Tax=Mycobacteroides abscessus TaxID=36809 RepID=UPI00092C198C|nr:condensation domain-containing protein [Mycobacteroides abscessus]SHZ30530.1 non-ribosomal peptide synthase/amino acid adenylation enzyme [Mycobacteroides abscessus subsp. abscessus]